MKAIQPLNLPPRQLQLTTRADGTVCVYDPLRHKELELTPEEWVRQHFVAHLIADLGYPPALMANEVKITLNGLTRRCDTVVWRSKDATPLVIVEYKRPDVAITSKVFTQIARYNMSLQADYLMVSNGLKHYCCKLNRETNSYSFLKEIPTYQSL